MQPLCMSANPEALEALNPNWHRGALRSWEEFKSVMLRREDGGYRRALHESRSAKLERLLASMPEAPLLHTFVSADAGSESAAAH